MLDKEMTEDKFDKKDKKLAGASLEKIIYDLLCRDHRDNLVSRIPLKFNYYIHFSSVGDPIILKHNKSDDTFSIVVENFVVTDIFHEFNEWVKCFGKSTKLPLVSSSVILSAVRSWSYQNNPKINGMILQDFPVQTRFKSEKGTCFTRLEYDPLKVDNLESQAPIFSKMLKRMSNSDAFVKKVGSFFDREGYRKQSLWLYGPSDGGKSAIQKLMQIAMGGTCNSVALTPGSMRNSFFKEMLVGKSLWLIREASAKFLNSEEYKSLTGDETHMINPKGRRMFSVDLAGHLVFSSNEKPEIRNEDALIRRVIPCLCSPVPDSEKMAEVELFARLEKEIPYIVGYCIEKYAEVGRKFIEFDDTELMEAIEDGESGFDDLLGRDFAFDSSKVGHDAEVYSSYLNMTLFPNAKPQSKDVLDFRKWLQSKGCKCGVMIRKKGQSPKRYITGIRKLTSAEYADMRRINDGNGRWM